MLFVVFCHLFLLIFRLDVKFNEIDKVSTFVHNIISSAYTSLLFCDDILDEDTYFQRTV